jgi:hypothetical protein
VYGAENWTLRKVDQKYLESSDMWCFRRMEKISWTSRVKNEEVLLRVKEERNILHTVKRRKASRIGHILHRNCLLKHVIEGEREGRNKRHEDEEEDVSSCWMTLRKRGYCKLNKEALDRTL